MTSSFDVIVIGAGQAGLAMGYFLKESGLRFLLLEAADQVGVSWRRRWESLTLFTPARYSSLPGLALPGHPGHFPTKDEVADYLAQYAATFDLPVGLEQRVTCLRPGGDGYQIDSERCRFVAKQVVIATGPFQQPRIPEIAGGLDATVTQLHSSRYATPRELPAGNVLVVGAGNSGWQIAEEIAGQRQVHLSQGRLIPRVPRRLLGRSLFGWLDTLGVMRVPADSGLGRRMQANEEVLVGERPATLLGSGRLQLHGRATWAKARTVGFENGNSLDVDVVIWATGYSPDYAWLEAPVLNRHGLPSHRRGVTDLPGLYFIGLRWQHTTGSALLGWVARDAEFLAEKVRNSA